MHLRGILWVFLRVLLVGFGLFGPGAARAPPVHSNNIFKVRVKVGKN